MRTITFSLLALGACQDTGGYNSDEGSSDAVLRVENDSDARLVLVSEEGNWNRNTDTQWFVDCGSDPPDVVTVTPVDGKLLINDSDRRLASACDVLVNGRDVKEIMVRGDGDLRIEGRVENLVSLEVRGDGEVDIDAVLTPSLDLIAAGSAEVFIGTLDAAELFVDLSGNGTVTIGGISDDALILTSGRGDLNAADLELAVLHIEMTGSGDATVFVTDFVSGENSGTGTLEILGDPEGHVD